MLILHTSIFTNKLKVFVLLSCLLLTHELKAQTITSTSDGGNWNSDTTWVGGVIPSLLGSDNVVIAAGATVTMRSPYSTAAPAICDSLIINGTLTIGGESASIRKIEITKSLLINSGGVLTNNGLAVHQITIGEDYINNGTFIPSVSSGSTQVTFVGTGTQVIGGTSTTQTFHHFIINKPSGQVESGGSVTTISVVNFTLTAGIFVAPASLTISGNMSDNVVGGFQAGTGTITFNGTSQSIGGSVSTSFNNVTGSGNTVITNTRTTTIGGNLTLLNGATFNVGGFDFTVNGTTSVGDGSTGTLVFASTAGTKLFIGKVSIFQNGTWNNSIGDNVTLRSGLSTNGTFTSGGGTYFFTTNSQSIDGVISLTDVEVSAGVILTNNGTLTVGTALSGAGSVEQGSNATLNIGGTSFITSLTASGAGNTVNYTGGVQTVKGIPYVNLGLSGTDVSHVKTLTNGASSISGNLSLSGITSTATVTNLTIGGNLYISDGATFTMAGDNVTVTGTTTIGLNSTLIFSSTIGIKTFSGLISVNGTWNNSGNEAIQIQSGLSNNGTFTAGTGIYRFETNSQTISGTLTIANVDVPTGITLTNNGTLTVSTALTGLGSFVQSSNSVLNLGGTVTISSLDPSGTNNTVNYSGGAQTVLPLNYVNLGLSGSGTKTLQAGTTTISGNLLLDGTASSSTVVDLSIGGNLSLAAGTLLTNNNTMTINGSLLGLGSITQSTDAILNINGSSSLASITASAIDNTVNYNAASPLVIAGSYYNLNLNPSSGDAVLNGSVTIEGTINLIAGNLDLVNNNLTINETAIISIAAPSATSMIVTSGSGEVRKVFTATGSFTFPVGETTGTSEYSPVAVQILSATGFSSAYIGVSVVDAKHPNNGSSTDFLTRYWKISQSGISGCELTVVGTYLNNDISGTEGMIISGQLTGTFSQVTNGWKPFQFIGNSELGVGGAILLNGQSSIFTGISAVSPTVNITGGDNAAVCAGTPVNLGADVTGEPTIVYSWTPSTGLSATNVANPSATPSTTTEYTLTVYDVNGISATDNTSVNINPLPAKPTITTSDFVGTSIKLTSSSTSGNQWYKNDGIIGGAISQELIVTENASYTVKVTNNGCTSPASDAYIFVIVGVESEITKNSRVYPNPANTVIQFDRSGFLPGVDIEVKVYDLMGRLHINKMIADSETSLDVNNLPKGSHIFVATQSNIMVIQKFVKN